MISWSAGAEDTVLVILMWLIVLSVDVLSHILFEFKILQLIDSTASAK